MKTIAVIGLDLAKSVLQVIGIDGAGEVVLRQRLSRARLLPFFTDLPPCLTRWASLDLTAKQPNVGCLRSTVTGG